jgi:hypothetical protein
MASGIKCLEEDAALTNFFSHPFKHKVSSFLPSQMANILFLCWQDLTILLQWNYAQAGQDFISLYW